MLSAIKIERELLKTDLPRDMASGLAQTISLFQKAMECQSSLQTDGQFIIITCYTSYDVVNNTRTTRLEDVRLLDKDNKQVIKVKL